MQRNLTTRSRTTFLLALVCVAASSGVVIAQGPPPPPPPLGPPPPPPPGNPQTPEKILLGKALFWDEQLSSTKVTACATCHIPEQGGADPRSVPQTTMTAGPNGIFGDADDVRGSLGVPKSQANGLYLSDAIYGLHTQVTGRKTQSVVNAAYNPVQFWDGRALGAFTDPVTNTVVFPNGASLESQALGPVVSGVEMAHDGRTIPDLVARVVASRPLALSPQLSADLVPFVANQTYDDLFTLAFGSPGITGVRIAEAIAAYERTQFSNQAPWDSFLGGNAAALTPQETQGFQIFGNPANGCAVCHAGSLLTNHSFQYIGVRPQGEDVGRMGVTGNLGDQGKMKVPSLRNVELRGSYFHNGRFTTLEEVVAFYNRGGDFNGPNKNPLIHGLGLAPGQQAALVAFLRRPLTDDRVRNAQPPFDHPALYSSSNRVPAQFGNATAGTGGFDPEMIAIEPALVGNPSFVFGVQHGLGDAQAVLAIDTDSTGGTPFGGATRYVALSPNLVIVRAGHMNGVGAGAGWRSVTLSIPNDAGLIGQTRFAQWFVLDLGAGHRFAASKAVQYTFFP
ncbi:MAG: hypothetical protein HZA53_07250 [Planctomycetes bacterium]|nr:hypothetical protein [Planctomycetota bacterium]